MRCLTRFRTASAYINTFTQQVLFERMTVPQVHIKKPALYGTQKFITVFTTAIHLCLSYAIWIEATPSYPITVIPRLTKIISSGITFVSRNILYKLYKYIIHFILLNWKYVHNVFTILLPNFQSLFKVSSWNGPTVHVYCFMLARASTKTIR